MELTEFFGAMLGAVVWLAGACFVGEILGRIIAPPINAWVERQNELDEERNKRKELSVSDKEKSILRSEKCDLFS